MVYARRMVEGVVKGKGHGTEMVLPGPDVAALPLQHHRRRTRLAIPTQQKDLEDSLVIGLSGGQYGNFYDGFRRSGRKTGLQCAGAKE